MGTGSRGFCSRRAYPTTGHCGATGGRGLTRCAPETGGDCLRLFKGRSAASLTPLHLVISAEDKGDRFGAWPASPPLGAAGAGRPQEGAAAGAAALRREAAA